MASPLGSASQARPETGRRDDAPAPPADVLEPFAPTLAGVPAAERHTSIISDVFAAAAARQPADTEPTFPSFDSIDVPPELPGIQILGVLGRGGMGIVYKGLQTELSRVVAVKMILSAALADPVAQQRFLSEAKAIAQLQHPHIIGIHEVGKHAGSPYFVLEYLSGGTLARQVAGKPQPPKVAAALAEQLARGMQAAHAKGIIHRDLKPLNILLAADGTPKITDFGLAKQTDDVSARTRSGEVVGTPNYMAPEQIDGRSPGVGPLTDVYALGALLYELLTGRPPFQGVMPMETLLHVLKQEVVPPSRLNQNVPADLETICLKCLRKEPGKRYGGAAELADDLKRFLAKEPIKARPISLPERGWRWCRRNPAVAALSGALLAMLVGGLVVVSSLYLKAERNLADARAKFDLAREAVDQLTTAGDELRDASDIPRIRQEMLRSGLRFYEEFLKERSQDPKLRHQTGNALRRIGDLQYQLGRLGDSEAAFREATLFLEALRREIPNDTTVRFDLAMAWKGFGITYANQRRFKDSEDSYRKAMGYAEELVQAEPTNPGFRKLLGDALNNLGLRLIAQGRLKEAEAAHWRSLEIRDQLLREDPDSLEKQSLAASIYSNFAYLLAQQGRLKEAEERNVMALTIRMRAVELQPTVSSHRKFLADTQLALGELYAQSDQQPKDEVMMRDGVRLRRSLAADFPTLPHHRRDYANSVHDLGVLLLRRGKESEAALQFRLAAELWRKIAADFPRRDEYRRRAQLMKAYQTAFEGDLTNVLTEVDQALAKAGADGEPVFFAARALALAAGRDSADAALKERFARRAHELLRQSWTMDYFRARWQLRDLAYLPEFKSLRERPDHQELLSSLPQP